MTKNGHNGGTWWVCFIPIGQFIVLEPGGRWCPHCTDEETGAQRKLGNSTHREPLWDGNLGSTGSCGPQCTVPGCQLSATVIWRWLVMMIYHCKSTLGFLSGRWSQPPFSCLLGYLLPSFLGASYQLVSVSITLGLPVLCVRFLSKCSSYV